MVLQVVPGYIGQSGYNHPVELFRNQLKAVTAGGKGYMKSTSDFQLTPSGAALTMGIAEGWAAIAGSESSSQGSYFVWSTGGDVVAWPGASGQPRIDSLLLRVIDKQYGTDASANGALWEVCQGTPAGSPTAIPDVEFEAGGDFYRPGAWWRVANVTISPGNTVMTATTIADLRAYADFQRANDLTLKNWYDNTINSAWTSFTPSFLTASGSPSLGTGGFGVARYKQVGKMVHYRGKLQFGSASVNFGTGGWSTTLPVNAANVTTPGALPHVGSTYYRDASGAHASGTCLINADVSQSQMSFRTADNLTDSTHPFTWAVNDYFAWNITYEAA